MKRTLSKALIVMLVLFVSIVMLSSLAMASGINLPLLDYTGSFTYCDGTNKGAAWCTAGGSPSNSYPYQYLLSFSNLNITNGQYSDGTSFGEGDDAVTDAWFEIGNLYNDNPSNNLIFGPTQPSGGSTGPVSFTLTDGTNDFFTGQIDNFIITRNTFGTRLNPLYDQENIINLTFNASAPSSRYIDEFKSVYDSAISSGSTYRPNLFGSFSFTSGTTDFASDAAGSIQGKLAAAPEPISSILFLSGGATLAARRYFRRKRFTI